MSKNTGCDFCNHTDFGNWQAYTDRYNNVPVAGIVVVGESSRFPKTQQFKFCKTQQFKFCPVCGKELNPDRVLANLNDGKPEILVNGEDMNIHSITYRYTVNSDKTIGNNCLSAAGVVGDKLVLVTVDYLNDEIEVTK